MKQPSKPTLTIGLLLDDSLDGQDGVQQYVLALGNWLTEQGHCVHYLAGHSTRSDLDRLHSLSRVVRLNFNGNRLGTPLFASSGKLTDLINAHQFDVIHVQSPHSPLLAGRLIKRLPKSTAIVSSLHVLPNGLLANWGLHLLGHLNHGSLKRIDRFIANTQAGADFFEKSWRVSSLIIPNPLDCRRFEHAQAHPAQRSDKLNIVFLGRLVKRKGVLGLIEAIQLLPKPVLDQIYVHLGGGGQLMPKAKASLDKYRLNKVCRLYGRIAEPDKASFLAMAEIAIFPSTGGESFGISLVEAMVAGRGVVLAGDNPGYRAVLDNRSELLFEASKPEAIAQTLQKWIAATADERRQSHQWLKQRAGGYDISQSVGPAILATYRQVLDAKSA